MSRSPQPLSGEISIASRSEMYCSLAEVFRSEAAESAAADKLNLPPCTPYTGADFAAAFDLALSKSASSLFEGTYAGRDRSTVFEDLVRFYSFFGLNRLEKAELPDHLSVELEFMHFLTFLEHETAARQNQTGGLRRAQRDFLGRHLLPLVQGIQASCKSQSPRVLAVVGQLATFVRQDHERLSA